MDRPTNARADEPLRILRTVFLSDVHLGSKGCRADLLLDFLDQILGSDSRVAGSDD